jgi:PAS domain S-box-containing protein
LPEVGEYQTMTGAGSIIQRIRSYADRARQWRATDRQRRDNAFIAEGLEACRRGMEVFCLFGISLLIVSAIDSYVAEREIFGVLFRIRFIAVAALLGIFALLRSRFGERWPRVLALVFVVVVSAMMHALALHTGGQESPQYERMNLVLLGLAVFATWPAGWAALACGLVIGVYVLGTAAVDGLFSDHHILNTLTRMVAASVVTVGATAVRERLRWRAFSDQRALAEADAKRQESEQRYQLLVETAGSAIIVLAPNRRILEFNREAEVFYGRSRHEVLGRDYTSVFLSEARRPDFARLLERVLSGEDIRTVESPVRSRHGERRVVAWNVSRVCPAGNEPVAVMAVGHDITERKRAEDEVQRLNAELEQRVQTRTAELRASEERFRTIFESAPIGIMTADRDGRVRHANRALQEMLGYGLGELQGKTLHDLTAEPDRQRSRGAFERLCEERGRELLIDKRYLHRDGATIWVHEAFGVVRDEAGEFAYALAMVEDVTERQRAEERARQHQEHLAHVLRVSTMGEMAAELAHELNQPLGAIVNFANGTLVRLRARGIAPDIEEAVAQIADEGMRAGEIIRRIRDFVRQGDSRRERSDLNHLVRQAAHLVEADARGHGIPVRLALDATLPPVDVDGIQVEQVIVNLLRNAIDAIVPDHRRDDEVLLQTCRSIDGSIEVRVRDTGIGLAPEAAARIFDAFFTTKRGGLGMGLSISRSIIEAHGGRLWAADNRDRGMTFSFSLPLAHGRRVAAA